MAYIRTEIFLEHPASTVWDILSDFDRYSEWNPLNIEATGRSALGARIPMTFLNPALPGRTISQTVTITTFEPGRALAWSGSIPLLFKGRHHFEIRPEGQGVRLLHGEDLEGLIPLFLTRARLERDFVPHYQAVNQALARRLAMPSLPAGLLQD